MKYSLLDQDRIQYVKAKLDATTRKALLPAWPRTDRELHLIEVDVDWVRFSTLNHRTSAEQRKVIHLSGRTDFFTSDPLGPAAQAEQFKILCNQEGFEDLKKDLNERGQQDNAVITCEGILINGNRRVAALRKLLHEDKNLDCRYVRCLVLPSDALEREVLQLETELQVAQDFKKDYSWVNEALLVEELYEKYNRDFEQVANLMHRPEKKIREDYEKIQQVNQLVAISRGNILHVDFLENESAFKELAGHIRNKSESEKESVRTVYFLGTLTGVNYRDLRHLQREDANVLVTEELLGDEQLDPLIKLVNTREKPADEVDDLLGGVLGEDLDVNLSRRVLEFVARLNPDSDVQYPSGVRISPDDVKAQIRSAINKAAEEAQEQQKDEDMAQAPLKRLERAQRELARVKAILPNSRAIPDWDESKYSRKLASVRHALEELVGAT